MKNSLTVDKNLTKVFVNRNLEWVDLDARPSNAVNILTSILREQNEFLPLEDKISMMLDIGGIIWKQGRMEKAQEILFDAEDILLNSHSDYLYGKLFYHYGELAYARSVSMNHDSLKDAFIFHQKAYGFRWQAYDLHGQVMSLSRLGVLYETKKEFAKAHKLFDQAVELAEQIEFHKGKACTYAHIARDFDRKEDLETAYKYYQKTLDLCIQVNYTEGTIFALYDVGWSGYRLGRGINNSVETVQLALQTAQQHDLQFAVGRGLYLLGELYAKEGQIQIANQYFDELKEFAKTYAYFHFVELAEDRMKAIA